MKEVCFILAESCKIKKIFLMKKKYKEEGQRLEDSLCGAQTL